MTAEGGEEGGTASDFVGLRAADGDELEQLGMVRRGRSP